MCVCGCVRARASACIRVCVIYFQPRNNTGWENEVLKLTDHHLPQFSSSVFVCLCLLFACLVICFFFASS